MDCKILVEIIPRWMTTKEAFSKVTSISLLSGHDFSHLSGVEAPALELLSLEGDRFSPVTLASNFFQGMKNLKVLSLTYMSFKQGLPKSMGQLKHLQTLHLHECELEDIKLIGKLVNLLVLSLRGSTLEELAIEIGELCKLRLLDMSRCKGKMNIPAKVLSRLSCLEGLYVYDSFRDWSSEDKETNDGEADDKASVSELYKLPHLNVLKMTVQNPQHLNDGQFAEQLGQFRICILQRAKDTTALRIQR